MTLPRRSKWSIAALTSRWTIPGSRRFSRRDPFCWYVSRSWSWKRGTHVWSTVIGILSFLRRHRCEGGGLPPQWRPNLARAACLRQHRRVGPAVWLPDSLLLSLSPYNRLYNFVRHPYNLRDLVYLLLLTLRESLDRFHDARVLRVNASVLRHVQSPPRMCFKALPRLLYSLFPAPAFRFSSSIMAIACALEDTLWPLPDFNFPAAYLCMTSSQGISRSPPYPCRRLSGRVRRCTSTSQHRAASRACYEDSYRWT